MGSAPARPPLHGGDHPAGACTAGAGAHASSWGPLSPQRHFPSFKRESSYSECEPSKTKHRRWPREQETLRGRAARQRCFLADFSVLAAPFTGGAGAPGPRVPEPRLRALRPPRCLVTDTQPCLEGQAGTGGTPRPPASCPGGQGDSARVCVRV